MLGSILAVCSSALPALADKKTWLFNGTTESWTTSSGTTLSDDGSNLVVNFATGGGLFSNVISPAFVPDANGNYIRFGYKLTSGNISQFQFNFKTTARNNFASSNLLMSLNTDGNYHWITFRLDNVGDWMSSTITQLRFIALASNGGGASGTLYLDYCFLRWDDANPLAPTVTTVTTGDWINHDQTVGFYDNDPPPNGFPSPVGPDVYGSGISDFRWHIVNGANTGPDTQKFPDTFDPSSGLATATMNVPAAAMWPGINVFHVYAFDKVARAGPDDHSFTIKYDPNPPPAPTSINAKPASWTNNNDFFFSWNWPADDYSGTNAFQWTIDGGAVSGFVGLNYIDHVHVPGAGGHSFQVQARDAAGNWGPWSLADSVFYDPNPPSTPTSVVVNPAGFSVADDFTVSWSGASDDRSGLCGYYYSVDGNAATFTMATSLRAALAAGQVGQHTFHVWAVDCAGNVSSQPQDASFYFYPQWVEPAAALAPSGTQAALPSTFSWNATGTGHTYYVQVSSDPSFATGTLAFYTDVPWFMVPAFAAPVVGQSYSWRVMTAQSYPANWSAAAQFTPYIPPPPPPAQVIGQEFPSGELGEGVNTSLGAVTRGFTILTLRGPGGEVPLNAWYSSISQRNGLIGSRWNWTLGQLLTPDGGAATVTLEDNQDIGFTQSGSTFTPGLGIYDSLATSAGGYDCVRPSRLKLSFDALGSLQRLTDRNGNAITLHYSGGVLTSFDDQAGRSYTATISDSRITQINDVVGGRTWRFEYDAGYLSAFTDAKGARTQFEYDGQGRMIRVIDPLLRNAIQYAYDADGRVQTQTDAYGKVTTFTYDDSSTTVTNPQGATQRHVRDANARLIADIDELGNRTTYAYDANHNRISMTDPRGNTTTYSYDPRGNLYLTVNALAEATETIFDHSNSPVYRRQPYAKVTRWTNDSNGNPRAITDAMSNVTSLTYNAAGQVTSVTDANQKTTNHVYDAQGNLTQTTNGAGDVSNFGYDAAGRRASMTYPAIGQTTSYAYDPDDSLTSTRNAEGEVASYEYDANGNRTVVTDPLGRRTTSTYDDKNRLTTVTDALGDVIRYAYDELDRRVSMTDPRGNTTTFAYDAAGNLTRQTDALGGEVRHTYDADRNRLTTTDQRVKKTNFAYDALNRLTSTSDPLGNVTLTAYDSLGRVARTTNPRGNATTYICDLLDRLIGVQAPTGGLLQYGYDPVGNRTSVTNANIHTTTMTYDGGNRLVTIRDPLGNTQAYTYDAAGRRTRRVDGRNRTTLYLYDGADRLTGTIYGDSTKILRSYDHAGNLTGMTDLWGSSSYAYDALNRIVASADDYGQSLAFRYDSTGNLSTLTYPDGNLSRYGYDKLNRMTSVTDWSNRAVTYGYDPTGNNTAIAYPNGVSTAQSFDDASRLASILTRTPAGDTLVAFVYTLDENSNRTRIVRVDRREDPIRGGGVDVYATSASLSNAAFPAGADSVVLASGEAWEEAVAAAEVARSMGVPELVVPGDNLWASAASQSELSRLKGGRGSLGSVVMGDIAGISPAVEAQLDGQGMPVRRVRGFNRFDTAAQAAGAAPVAVLLGGTDPARAGAAVLLAAHWNAPLLLTERDSVPSAVHAAMAARGVTRTLLVGDETTIGAAVASWLGANGFPVLKRYASSDPAAITAQALEDTLIGSDRYSTIRFANKSVYQDALSAAADPSTMSTPTLLCSQDSVFNSPDLVRWIGRHKGWLKHAVLLGPTSALSSNVEAQLRAVLRTTITEYGYSQLDELTSEIVPGVDTTTYMYDAMGNRASITHDGTPAAYTYDAADRLVVAGPNQYAYDGNGNRVSKAAGSSTTYAYDFENRLIQINGSAGTSAYRYDGLGRRIRSSEPSRTVRYALDPTSQPYRTLRETDDAGATLMVYTYGVGLASEIAPSSASHFYHYDALGSTAAVTDSAGEDFTHLGYTAFGNSALALCQVATRFGYVGRHGVEVTDDGLHFMRDRFYDPQLGAFLSRDPILGVPTDFLSAAAYLYADGNPTTLSDPSGRDPNSLWNKFKHKVTQVVHSIAKAFTAPHFTREWHDTQGEAQNIFEGHLEKNLPSNPTLGGAAAAANQLRDEGIDRLAGGTPIGTAAATMHAMPELRNYADFTKLENLNIFQGVTPDMFKQRLLLEGGMRTINGVQRYDPTIFNKVWKEFLNE